MTPQKPSSEPALADRLEEDILFGRLRPRERLVEDDLMARTGATRHAVRGALVEMEQRQLVVRVPNKGAQVRDFERVDIEQICDMRDWLHERAARAMRFPADPAWIAGLEQLQRQHDAAVASAQPVAVHRTNAAFHAALFAGCGNRYLTHTINEYAQLSLAYRCHLMTRTDLANQAAREHWEIIAALRQSDVERLAKLCVHHTKAARAVYESLQGWGAKATP
ncbi:MAG: GntR family transcriptional regulator [Burkholderiaceae bacterium]